MNVFQYKHLDELKKWLCGRHDELHLENSMIMPRICVVGKDGTMYRGQGAKGLCLMLNGGLNADYDILSTYSVGRNRGTIFYGIEKEIKEFVQEEKEEVIEPVVEVVVDELISLDVGPVTVEVEESVKEPDWVWIESLENTPEDKLEFDKYCEAEYGLRLSRTMKLSNMIKKFKEELSKQ